ncbi:hypothetical protein Hdeb2414_s0008g00267101 [Helianthus debilis subsp. tardiflorus]
MSFGGWKIDALEISNGNASDLLVASSQAILAVARIQTRLWN